MPEVVLVHGLWYRGWSMFPLARRLRRRGFRVRCFSYPTLVRTPESSAEELAAYCAASDAPEQHLVGYSLGGMLIMRMFALAAPAPRGRVLLLGAPLSGSRVAKRVNGKPTTARLLGRSAMLLENGFEGAVGLPRCGMIAGTHNIGLGRLSGTPIEAGDGTVALDETRHPAVADRLELPVSHTGLLLSADVARQVATYLSRGHFSEG